MDDAHDTGDTRATPTAVALRDGIRAYLRAMHEAYLAAGGGTGTDGVHSAARDDRTGDGDDGDGTLAAAPFTVVVVAARSLHLVATREQVVAPEHAAAIVDTVGPLEWRTMFLDSSVLPALDMVPAGPDEIPAVRTATGVTTTLYHLAAGPGAALSAHHATHTGTGLAHRERARR